MTVGIDLGTTNALVAVVDGGTVRLIPNSRGRLVTPSVVGVDAHGELLVGEAAANQAVHRPGHTVRQAKRLMGRRTTVPLGRLYPSPEEVSATILRSLRTQAAAFLGDDVRSAVITVPAHFDDHQRYATYEAALLAGFATVLLLNEPTAAALPYATRDTRRERMVVFDFGGGTLDVTCLERDGHDFAVRATVGDGQLGGADIDEVLATEIRTAMRDQTGADTGDPRLQQVALDLAERAKIDLSEVEHTEVSVPFLAGGPDGAGHVRYRLDRTTFDRLVAPFVARARTVAQRAVAEAGFDREGFDRLILAGGSSRVPAIRSMLEETFHVPVANRINPEEVIGTGAALYAANRDAPSDGFRLRDVLSGTLAIELADGGCVPLVRKNQTVPTRQSRVFTTVSDGQQEAEIHLVQGNHSQAWRNRSLGRFVLRDIRRAPQGAARIAVTVEVSSDGIVTVRAGDRDTGASGEMVARARPEPVRHPIQGGRDRYAASLRRRARALRLYAVDGLREEIDEVVSIMEEGDPKTGEDTMTVLETLLRETVIAASSAQQREHRHASR